MRMYRKSFRSNCLVGAIKIKDGLFLGDEFSVRDLEFQSVHKITQFINCAGKQIQNRNIRSLKFLTFNWLESDKQVLFDQEGNTIRQIIEFLREADSNGEGVLIHSVKGINRSACAIIAFFMAEYKWSLAKSLEFLNIRRPGLKIQQSFMQQLQSLEKKLKESNEGATIDDWSENQFSNETEQLVKNTFHNSKTTATQQAIKRKIFNLNQMKKENIKLRWSDHQPGGKLTQYFGVPQRKNFKITTVNYYSPTKNSGKGMNAYSPYQTTINSQHQKSIQDKTQENNDTIKNNQANSTKKTQITSILKGSNKCIDIPPQVNKIQNGEENENVQNPKIDIYSSPYQAQSAEKQQQNSSFQAFGNNQEENVEMTQSLSPQKLSRNEMNNRINDSNPLSLSEQFNKPLLPQQNQFIKNIFKIQQNQLKHTSQIQDSNDGENVKPMTNNFTNPQQKNTLANAFSNNSQIQQHNNQSPAKYTQVLNAPLRVSHLVQDDNIEGQNEIPDEDPDMLSDRQKISNLSQYNNSNRTFNFRRQNNEKLGISSSEHQQPVSQNEQTNRTSEIQLSEFQTDYFQNTNTSQNQVNSQNQVALQNANASQQVGGNLILQDALTSIRLDNVNSSQQQGQLQQSNQSDQVIQSSKGLMSFKVIVVPKNNQNNMQFSDGQMRPNTATNMQNKYKMFIKQITTRGANNPEIAEDPKFSTQRINDQQNGSYMNAFKAAASSDYNRTAINNQKFRPSSMDQQNTIFKQLNKKQMIGKSIKNSVTNSHTNRITNNSINANMMINSVALNPYSKNQQKLPQYQYKQAVQSYINQNTINQFQFSNGLADNNDYMKKKIK